MKREKKKGRNEPKKKKRVAQTQQLISNDTISTGYKKKKKGASAFSPSHTELTHLRVWKGLYQKRERGEKKKKGGTLLTSINKICPGRGSTSQINEVAPSATEKKRKYAYVSKEKHRKKKTCDIDAVPDLTRRVRTTKKDASLQVAQHESTEVIVHTRKWKKNSMYYLFSFLIESSINRKPPFFLLQIG